MEKMIVSRLREIEEKENVHILLAVESRAPCLGHLPPRTAIMCEI